MSVKALRLAVQISWVAWFSCSTDVWASDSDLAADPRARDAIANTATASIGHHEADGMDSEAGARFWSYRPLRTIIAPDVADSGWPRNEIDRFILNQLEST